MKKERSLQLFLGVVVIMLAGCGINTDIIPDGNDVLNLSENSDRISSLDDGTRLDGSASTIEFEEVNSIGSKVISATLAIPYTNVIAEVAAPSIPGMSEVVLGATHIHVNNDYSKAYVSYNFPEPQYPGTEYTHVGAIDIIDIKDAAKPELLQTIYFDDADINASFVFKKDSKSGYLYAAGGMSRKTLSTLSGKDESSFEAKNATLELLPLDENGLVKTEEGTKLTNLPGYQMTSIFQTSYPVAKYIFVTAGDHPDAGTSYLKYDTLQLMDHDAYDNAKYLDIEMNSTSGRYPKHVTLQGGRGGSDTGILHIYTVGKNDVSAHLKIDIGAVDTQDTRNTVSLLNNIAYTALGAGGMKAWDVSKPENSEPLYTMSIPEDESWSTVCNSADSDGEFAFLAMGGAGLWVAPLSEGILSPFKALNFGQSANFVHYDSESDLLFVAGGTDGLKILSR